MAKSSKKRQAKKKQFKSSLERWFSIQARKINLKFEYEPDRFRFIRVSHYIPDFKIRPGVYIETKGYLAPSDRAKLLAFKEQFPEIEIRLVFGNARNKLNKRSKQTYGEWATKHGYKWIDMRDGLEKIISGN